SGRRAEALACAGRGLASSRERSQRGNEADVHRLLGEIFSERDHMSLAEAETHYQDAIAIAEDLGMRPLVAHCHLSLGKLYHRTHQREQAQKEFVTAAAMYRGMGMMYWLEKADAHIRSVIES